jgi:uncharacterized protein
MLRQPPPAPTSSDAEVEVLHDLCRQLAGFDDAISLEWVDGFMTALLAGPRAVMPGEWLPAMFGDAFGRAFADPVDVQRAMAALLGRWNVIARQLDPETLMDHPDALRLSPLIVDYDAELRAAAAADGGANEPEWLPPNGAVWAEGFLDGVRAFAADWPDPDPHDELAPLYRQGLAAVRALTLDDAALAAHVAAEYPGQSLDRDDLIDEACFGVQELRLYWVDRAPRPQTVRVAPRPGRNDPCPCGSGRKYKKCCGAAAPH